MNPVPRTYVRGFGALPFGEVQNIHPRTHVRGVLWYGVKSAKAKPVRAADPQEVGLGNNKLFEVLRKWRREKAAAMGNVPAYLVYTDQTLQDLARRMPRTEADLLQVRGIGPAKARQFGAETVAVIQEFVRKSVNVERA